MALDLDLQLPVALPSEAPPTRARLVLLSVLAGLAPAVVWSASLVDSVIGRGISDSVLGTEAEDMAFTGSFMAAIFAFVTGIAGTFTACNIAVFGAIAPMVAQRQSFSQKLLEVLKPVGWLGSGRWSWRVSTEPSAYISTVSSRSSPMPGSAARTGCGWA